MQTPYLVASGTLGVHNATRVEEVTDVSDSDSSRLPFSGRQVAGGALLLVAVIFVLQNRSSTTIRFLIPEITAPLWVALFVSVLLGVLAGGLLARKSG